MKTPRLKVGDWIEVRSKEEILKTLDSNGQLEGMPFMPEMFAFCGRRFQVYRRAHKTCDTVYPVRGRRVKGAVHLETRCNGQAHGGCEAGCLIFWKEQWLKPVNSDFALDGPPGAHSFSSGGITEAIVRESVKVTDGNCSVPKYRCQATQLPHATKDLKWWDVRQYLEDYLSGNVGLWQVFCGFVYALYYRLSQAGIGLGPVMVWFYNRVCPLWGGSLFPRTAGKIPSEQPTPTGSLDLQPGELVRVKSHEEILSTLNTDNRNRGMSWDAEMVPYCGKTYKVLKRVTKIVNEKTGEMQRMKTPCIILDSVICQSKYSPCRMFCPRGIYPYWREIWLERVGNDRLVEHAESRQVGSPS